jgi:hypothetical protein
MRLTHRALWLAVIVAGTACTAGRSRAHRTPLGSSVCDGDPYLEVANFSNQPVQIFASAADGSRVSLFVGTAHEGTTRLRLEGTPAGKEIYFFAQVNHEAVSGVNITRRCDPPK